MNLDNEDGQRKHDISNYCLEFIATMKNLEQPDELFLDGLGYRQHQKERRAALPIAS